MPQGVAVSFIVIGAKNAWWSDVVCKRRVDLQKECYELYYPQEWQDLPRKTIIADEKFFNACFFGSQNT